MYFSVELCLLQGYTLAEEEEDSLIFQHRHLRGNQGDTLVSGPVEAGPMKKLHVSTTALQKVSNVFNHKTLYVFVFFKTDVTIKD